MKKPWLSATTILHILEMLSINSESVTTNKTAVYLHFKQQILL